MFYGYFVSSSSFRAFSLFLPSFPLHYRRNFKFQVAWSLCYCLLPLLENHAQPGILQAVRTTEVKPMTPSSAQNETAGLCLQKRCTPELSRGLWSSGKDGEIAC